jgi:hypothetical protein
MKDTLFFKVYTLDVSINSLLLLYLPLKREDVCTYVHMYVHLGVCFLEGEIEQYDINPRFDNI